MPRVGQRLKVEVSGFDSEKQPFLQTAYAHDVSRWGVRLDGIYCLPGPCVVITIKHKARTTRFLVIWIGQPGTQEQGHIGLRNLEPEKNIWRVELPKSTEDNYSDTPGKP